MASFVCYCGDSHGSHWRGILLASSQQGLCKRLNKCRLNPYLEWASYLELSSCLRLASYLQGIVIISTGLPIRSLVYIIDNRVGRPRLHRLRRICPTAWGKSCRGCPCPDIATFAHLQKQLKHLEFIPNCLILNGNIDPLSYSDTRARL